MTESTNPYMTTDYLLEEMAKAGIVLGAKEEADFRRIDRCRNPVNSLFIPHPDGSMTRYCMLCRDEIPEVAEMSASTAGVIAERAKRVAGIESQIFLLGGELEEAKRELKEATASASFEDMMDATALITEAAK